MANEKHRPPHSKFAINEMIEIGRFDEAQAACDENVEWYSAKADEFRELYVHAQIRKIGAIPVKPVPYEFGPVLKAEEQANR